MKLEIELWHMILLLISFFGVCGAAGKLLLGQVEKSLDKQFETQGKRLDGIEATHNEEAKSWQRVERELMALKVELPQHYVRREDYIRGQSILENKMDSLAGKLEIFQLRIITGVKNDH